MKRNITLSLSIFIMLGTISSAAQLDDLLELDLNDLANIEIATVYGASRTTQRTIDAPANVTIITAEEIKRRNFQTLTEAISTQSGFYMSYDRNYVYLGVRGFNSPGDYNTKILTIIDGQRVNENIYSSSALGENSDIDMDTIEHIEIIRGPGSALYGSSALFAVINIVTKDAKNYNNGKVAMSYGSYGTDREKVALSHIFDNDLEILASASRYHSDGDKNLYYKEFDSPATNNGNAENIDSEDAKKFLFKAKLDNFTFQTLFYDRKKLVPTAAWDTIFNTAVTTRESHGYSRIQYDAPINNKLKISTALAYNFFDFEGDYIYEDGGPTLYRDEASTSWIDGSVDLSYKQNDSLNWLIGFYAMDSLKEEQQSVYASDPILNIDAPIDRYAFYMQNIYQATQNLSFTFGLRYDYYESFGGNISPKVSAVYALSDVTSLKLVYGEAFRAPNAYELYYNDGYFDSIKANPSLEEENIKNYELMLEHYFSTKNSVSFNAFYYEIENLITQITDPIDGLSVFENLNKAESKGLELNYTYGFDNGINGSINYTHQKAIDKQTSQWLVNSPKNLANASISIPFLNKYNTTISASYVGKNKNLSGGIVDEYTLCNLSVNAKDILKGLDISMFANNLFDTNYASVVASQHVQTEIIQNGLSANIKVTYKF